MKLNAVRRNKWFWLVLAAVIVIILYTSLSLTGSVPDIRPVENNRHFSYTAPATTLAWPAYGQSAIGIAGAGVVETNGKQTALPMASTAKLITALVVLERKPLSLNEQGPSITLSSSDVGVYNQYQSENGSDLLVTSGEQLSEYQMLEAMLLPSADNIADSLAIWAYGSINSYKSAADQYLKTNELDATKIGADASGYDPGSITSAAELVRIGMLAEANPVIAQIVAKPSTTGFPIVGTINNVNSLLGSKNIIGIKTGNNNQDGGVFVSASTTVVNGQTVTIYTAILGAPTLWDVLHSSSLLISSAQTNFSTPSAVAKINRGTIVGQYTVPWSKQTISAIATRPIYLASWGNSSVSEDVNLDTINDKAVANQVVGNISVNSALPKATSKTAVVLAKAPGKPSVFWMLTHPGEVIKF